MSEAYSSAGVDTARAGRGVGALVSILKTIELERPTRSVLPSGQYACVLELAPALGVALTTDGVGTKVIVAESTGRLHTVGIDCVAMNVNDVVCVGAEPIALLDYLAVEQVDEGALTQIATGLKRGAEMAGVEIPGGELAVLPEIIRGHPSPHGFDLSATCLGVVQLDAMVTGERARPGDVLVGLPSSGLHSNGYTLARRVLLEDAGLGLNDRPGILGGRTLADALLEPTTIYVRAIRELLDGDVDVRGLAHITGDGLLNLLRLDSGSIGFEIDDPLPVAPICALVCELGAIGPAEGYEVFNMGCGFVAIVPEQTAARAVELLDERHPGTRVIGRVTDQAGRVTLPPLGLIGDREGLRLVSE
jgi:phosphoribosylformylglycinamidine cyclo-ligase